MNKPERDVEALINEVYSAQNLLEPYKAALYPFDGNADNVLSSSSLPYPEQPSTRPEKLGRRSS